jgi:hypothetical protein
MSPFFDPDFGGMAMPGQKATAKSTKPTNTYWEHQLDVLGLKFRWKRDMRRGLADTVERRRGIAGIRLVREPENKYDPNAIAVYLPRTIDRGKQLGYLRRGAAELLAPRIDDGSLVIVGAKLMELFEDDDWNSGPMIVSFKNVSAK